MADGMYQTAQVEHIVEALVDRSPYVITERGM